MVKRLVYQCIGVTGVAADRLKGRASLCGLFESIFEVFVGQISNKSNATAPLREMNRISSRVDDIKHGITRLYIAVQIPARDHEFRAVCNPFHSFSNPAS